MDKCGFCGGVIIDKQCVSCKTHYPCKRNHHMANAIHREPDQFDPMTEEQWQDFFHTGGHLLGENYPIA